MRILLLVLLVLTFSGCTTIKNVDTVDDLIRKPALQTTITSVDLTDAERLVVTHAVATYERLRAKWLDQVRSKGLDELIKESGELNRDYQLMVTQYNKVMTVVMHNYDKYSEHDVSSITAAAAEFERLHKSYKKFTKMEEIKDSVKVYIKALETAVRVII